ncbi:MAG: DUF1501 domain-containing protein [Bacteroidota bacterium]
MNDNQRHGSALEHGKAHQRDHQNWSRRGFLKNLGLLGGTSMLLGQVPVQAIGASPLTKALGKLEGDRILVLIRLKGGNDGLNTIIPVFDYDRYAGFRPSIRIPESNIIGLTDEFGMPNTLSDLVPLWEEGGMSIVNSVGYPEQNLSHFRSTDIWASASDSNVIDSSGWLGRYLGQLHPDYLENPPDVPPAIQIGSFDSFVFSDLNNTNIAVSVADPGQLEEIAENGQLYDLNNLPDCIYGEQLGYMRTVANSTFFYAESISEASNTGQNSVDYPQNNPLARSLATVARLVKGKLGTKLYMVTLDGFDTHANQSGNHARLMTYLGEAVATFYQDLEAGGMEDKVLSMTFSEFGRRARQNASNGTDHGAAAPVILFGKGMEASAIKGKNPDLGDLDPTGNIKFDTDFRQLYATVLEKWLCINPAVVNQVLGYDYERVDLGFDCSISTDLDFWGKPKPTLTHRVIPSSGGDYIIQYDIPTGAKVQIQVFSVMGQTVATLAQATQMAGQHQVTFSPSEHRVPSGQYFYRIQVGSRIVSGGMQVVR